MTQAWLTVCGLALDGLGFVILLLEWWLAVFNESRQAEIDRERERLAEMGRLMLSVAQNPQMQRHLEAVQRMQQGGLARSAQAIGSKTLGRRKAAFVLAAALILSGTALQILGAIPGCCGALGIVPG